MKRLQSKYNSRQKLAMTDRNKMSCGHEFAEDQGFVPDERTDMRFQSPIRECDCSPLDPCIMEELRKKTPMLEKIYS